MLKALGVTFTSTLTASDHVRRVISGSAQSLRTASAAASRSWRGWSPDGFPSCRCLSFDLRNVSVERRGLDLSPVQISSALKHSFAAASEVVTVRRICQTLLSWWRKATTGCSEKSSTIQAMFCTDCFPLPLHRSSNTTCGVVHMTDKCPNTRDTWPIKLLNSHAFYRAMH